MKLDYVNAEAPDCPFIRLADFTPAEASELLAVVAELATEKAERVEVHALQFVESIRACRLTLLRHSWDQAVICAPSPPEFECGLTAGGWENVGYLIEPFTKGARGFQWLVEVPGEAGLLFSPSGEW